jgi:transcriptional regulator with XRE-family HTH domain
MDRKSVEEAYLADVRLWIANNLERLGLNAHQLSKRTGVSAMTISRLMDEAKSTVPSIPTLYALEKAFNQKAPQYGGAVDYFDTDDAIPVPESNATHFIVPQHLSLWRMQSFALEGIGVRPGDFVIVDMNREPKHLDTVLAEVKDWDRPEVHSIFRQYLANPTPMLVARSSRSGIPFDGFYLDRATKITGVIVATVKPMVDRG